MTHRKIEAITDFVASKCMTSLKAFPFFKENVENISCKEMMVKLDIIKTNTSILKEALQE